MNKINGQIAMRLLCKDIGHQIGAEVIPIEMEIGGGRPHWMAMEDHPGFHQLEILAKFEVPNLDRKFVLMGSQDSDYNLFCMLEDYELQVFPAEVSDAVHMNMKPDDPEIRKLVAHIADKLTRQMTQAIFDDWLGASIRLNAENGHPLLDSEVKE